MTNGNSPDPDSYAAEIGKSRAYNWKQSNVIKTSLLCLVVIFIAALLSMTMSIKSLDSIVKVSYQDKTKNSLRQHLDTLKNSYRLRQELIIASIGSQAQNLQLSDPQRRLEAISKIVERANNNAAENGEGMPFEIRFNKEEQGSPKESTRWISRSQLIIEEFLVIFDNSKVLQNFEEIQSAYQDFTSASFHLKNNIGPQLIFYNGLLLVAVFLLIGIILFLLANYISKNIDSILNGLIYWVKHPEFRYRKNYSGEFRALTGRINQLLDEVEEKRKKNIYLEKVASWQTIARKLAHEVKNPLTPIQIMVSHLQRSYAKGDPQFSKHLDKACKIIPEEIASLKRMVNSFSDFAKLPQPKMHKLELVEAISHTVELEKAEYSQHRFRMSNHSSKMYVLGDLDLLKQVFKNLIKNACQACGSNPSEIEIEMWSEDDKVHLSFKDNGPGIPPASINKVFEAYFSTKDSGPDQGMGLGLAICRKIIIDHGGSISVSSSRVDPTPQTDQEGNGDSLSPLPSHAPPYVRSETVFSIVLPAYSGNE